MQCEYVTSKGQCPNEAVTGRFCEEHSAQSHETMLNQYRIAGSLIGDAVERHAGNDQIKSIKVEIAIMRSMIEKRINMCGCDAELMAAMPALREFALAVEKMAVSCHAMDVKLGNLLDKQALMSLAQQIIGVISKHIRPLADTTPTTTDIDLAIETIGREIVEAIAQQENPK